MVTVLPPRVVSPSVRHQPDISPCSAMPRYVWDRALAAFAGGTNVAPSSPLSLSTYAKFRCEPAGAAHSRRSLAGRGWLITKSPNMGGRVELVGVSPSRKIYVVIGRLSVCSAPVGNCAFPRCGACATSARPLGGRARSPLVCDDFFHRIDLDAALGEQSLLACVLTLWLAQSACFRNIHAAKLLPPLIECVLGNAMGAADSDNHLPAAFGFAQNSDDLFLAELRLFLLESPLWFGRF